MNFDYIILGAGPAGLACAQTLIDNDIKSLLVIEKEDVAGGLCRSSEVDGYPLDIGGGHILDVKRPNVLDFVFRFLPQDEWEQFSRISTIKGHDYEIDYPFEANIWQLPVDMQVDFLESISVAGCIKGEPMPESFKKWITWKLGNRIAKEYMLPYNRKIWSVDLNTLGTYWLYKLPDVSFRDTLLSCLKREQTGSLPAHAQFYYPKKYGYGEVFKRMGEALGDRLLTNTPITHIDPGTITVNRTYQTKHLITTIPWVEWKKFPNIPKTIQGDFENLKHTGVQITYHNEPYSTKAHWTYVPDESIPYHRILWRKNFCSGSRGYWTETNPSRIQRNDAPWDHINPYAYPLNTRAKPESIKNVLKWAKQSNIHGLGRWGEWEHMNSDVAVERGINMALNLLQLR